MLIFILNLIRIYYTNVEILYNILPNYQEIKRNNGCFQKCGSKSRKIQMIRYIFCYKYILLTVFKLVGLKKYKNIYLEFLYDLLKFQLNIICLCRNQYAEYCSHYINQKNVKCTNNIIIVELRILIIFCMRFEQLSKLDFVNARICNTISIVYKLI